MAVSGSATGLWGAYVRMEVETCASLMTRTGLKAPGFRFPSAFPCHTKIQRRWRITGSPACYRRVRRAQIGLLNGIRETDDIGLLLAVGGDCAGALSVLPDGITPEAAAVQKRALTDMEVAELVHSAGKEIPTRPDGTRFALAGAQKKLAVVHDGNYSLSGCGRHSSHILKFETLRRICFA